MKAIISGRTYQLNASENRLMADDTALPEIVCQLPNGNWLLRDGGNLMELEVISQSKDRKQFKFKSGHQTFDVLLRDRSDDLLEKMGFQEAGMAQSSAVKAPMPGLISKVLVETGTVVSAGDPLFVLDAMKMENLVKAPVDATISAVLIKPGDRVEKGQELILF